MRGLTVIPSRPNTLALRTDLPEPVRPKGALLVESLFVGVCGTDREIVEGKYGAPPEGDDYLILGHESLGRVVAADDEGAFRVSELVVGIVRRPDPVPCICCAQGEWDMCMNGLFTERGILGAHGYASERFTLEEEFAIAVPETLGPSAILIEPASVVAKAWEQVERIAARSSAIALRNVLITGAGPVGLLAALLAVQRGYEVTVLDRVSDGPKPRLVRALGARYAAEGVSKLELRPDIVIECTGSEQVVVDVLRKTAHNSVVCLAGMSSGARKVSLSASSFNDSMVLENDVVFGTVNANKRHYDAAVSALSKAESSWLSRLVTRCVPLSRYQEAFEHRDDDVKVVLEMRR